MSYYPQQGGSQRSPPPLQHPIPTHAHYQIPEPPSTPHQSDRTSTDAGTNYSKFTSPPIASNIQPMPVPQQYGQPTFINPANMGPAYGGNHAYPSFPTAPSLAAWGVNDATTQLGVQLGRNVAAAGQEYVEKNLSKHFLPLAVFKHQFNVSNYYVLQKLRVLLFPWRHRPWSRKVRRSEANGQTEGFLPPREDINSPDLYIPTMALVTYVLTTAFLAGLRQKFRPELLGVTASKALAVIVLEFGVIQAGSYFLGIQSQAQILDLVAYTGYKFVHVILIIICGEYFGGKIYALTFVYAFAANAFFLLRSMRYAILPDQSADVGNSGVSHAQRGWRIRFLFCIAMSQILYMTILAWA